MQLVAPEAYPEIVPLVPSHEVAGHMTFPHAVLSGLMPGAVFVTEDRESAIILNHCGFHVAIGEANGAAVAEAMPGIIAALEDEPGSLLCSTPEWAAALSPLFAESLSRNEYRWDDAPTRGNGRPPDGLRLARITADIAERFQDAVDPWVVRIWGGPEEMARKSFGWALLDGDVLASFCAACAIGGGEAEIEIGTNPAYQRRGLAEVVGRSFISLARLSKLMPAWTCDSANEGSIKLAEKLGFEFTREITGFPLQRDMVLEDGRWARP